MAAYDFPNSPTDGQTVTVNGIVYTYNSTKARWDGEEDNIALTDFSISTNSVGTSALSYSGGVFTYTPPDLSSYATHTETVYALSGTDFDAANGRLQTKTISADTTFTDSLSSGESIILMLAGGATYTVTWPTITWVGVSGNTAPTLTANDTFVFWKISTSLYGAYVGSYA